MARPDPSRWPSNEEVMAILRERNPERYELVKGFSYTPGIGPVQSAEQIADAIQSVDAKMFDPVYDLASRLDGEAFLFEDAAECALANWGGSATPEQTAKRRYDQRLGVLLRRAADQLRAYRDRDASLAEDAERLSPEGVAARADEDGIAQPGDPA